MPMIWSLEETTRIVVWRDENPPDGNTNQTDFTKIDIATLDNGYAIYRFPPRFFLAPNLTDDGVNAKVDADFESESPGRCCLSSRIETTLNIASDTFIRSIAIAAVPAS